MLQHCFPTLIHSLHLIDFVDLPQQVINLLFLVFNASTLSLVLIAEQRLDASEFLSKQCLLFLELADFCLGN